MTTYYPNIELPRSAVAPDNFIEVGEITPSGQHIVSRKRDGSAASLYADRCWDMSAYHDDERKKLWDWGFWEGKELTPRRVKLIEDAKRLMFMVIWLRSGSPLAMGTLSNYFWSLRQFVMLVDKGSNTTARCLKDETWLQRYFSETGSSQAGKMLSVLALLNKLGDERTGFISLKGTSIKAFNILAESNEAATRQHAPIPTRIYSLVLSRLTKELLEWKAVRDETLTFVSQLARNRSIGRSRTIQIRVAKKNQIPLKLAPIEKGFSEIAPLGLVKILQSRNMPLSILSLSRFLNEVQYAARLLLQAYTGMRDKELRTLMCGCLKIETSNTRTHYLVKGQTSKGNKGGHKKNTQWVTNVDGALAIGVAQELSIAICKTLDEEFSYDESSQKQKIPLFTSTRHLKFSGGHTALTTEKGKYAQTPSNFTLLHNLKKRLEPIIEEEDLQELERIDFHRAWRSEEKFKKGKPWTLTGHQFRRSLALYAQRSGLVSLPSLRRQLQHLTEEMSTYYANGSSFAKNFIEDDTEHFAYDWRATAPESAALKYIFDLLFSNKRLVGGHIHWLKHQHSDSSGNILLDRDEVLARAKRGELAYTETLLGGCAKVGSCDRPALDWLNISCLEGDCANLVCDLALLERVIIFQESIVSELTDGDDEYRTEVADLNVLKRFRERHTTKNGGLNV